MGAAAFVAATEWMLDRAGLIANHLLDPTALESGRRRGGRRAELRAPSVIWGSTEGLLPTSERAAGSVG